MANEPTPRVIRDLFSDVPRTIPPRDEGEWRELYYLLGSTFSPHQPINEKDLFVGRIELVAKVLDTTFQAGKHVALFGDRGVGKSSLANSIRSTLATIDPRSVCIKRMCTVEHDFGMIWRHVFDDFQIDGTPVPEILGKSPNPYDVFKIIRDIEPGRRIVVVLDEFDRITDEKTKSLMSDLIKSLSDNDDRTTVVIVGVAKNIAGLFRDHASLPRAMAQVPMPRMNNEELEEIVSSRLPQVGMEIDQGTLKAIVSLSQGFPGFTHLIALNAARMAVARKSVSILPEDLQAALKIVVEEADQSVADAYFDAVRSSRTDHQYREVLLGCALAKTDERNRFTARAVGEALKGIGIEISITSFGRNLEQFCSTDRGPTLIREGLPKNYQYSFDYPLLKPYTIIKGLSEGTIRPNQLR
jgi:Cdc6-like AAA superfamily ATPase